MALTKDRLAELIAAAQAKHKQEAEKVAAGIQQQASASSEQQASAPAITVIQNNEVIASTSNSSGSSTGMHGESIELNEQQQLAVKFAYEGKSFCLTGAAGTGKTTTVRAIITALTSSGRIPPLADSTKNLTAGSPGCVSIAYTRRAVANIAKAMPENMHGNCLTHHSLIEYEPEYYTVTDDVTGLDKETMRFAPARNAYNPLPSSLVTIIIEESSMYSTDLYAELLIALPDPDNVQFIFLGDLFQLPPVYGAPILGFKLNELPVVELTHVYRQALESPIIRLAHHIKDGKLIPGDKFEQWAVPNQLTIHPWKKAMPDYQAVKAIGLFICNAIETGAYNTEEDVVLTPYNKAFGTLEINNIIANYLGKQRGAIVHEVIAGFNKYYFAEGDKVLYEKNDAIIRKIARNTDYVGKRPQVASATLDRWGVNQNFNAEKLAEEAQQDAEFEMLSIDAILESHANDDVMDRKNVASHSITLEMVDSGVEVEVDTAGAINKMIFGYALTVHKSQGSEWRKVFLVMHKSQNTMISRELLYTAITRARQELYVVCEPDHFIKGVVNQRIKGNTIAEKAKFFKGKEEEQQKQMAMILAAQKHEIKRVDH